MTDEELIKANVLKGEIRELELFILSAEKVWTGKIIKKESKYIFRSSAYGFYEAKEFELKGPIKNKVLDVLRIHLKELKKELESI